MAVGVDRGYAVSAAGAIGEVVVVGIEALIELSQGQDERQAAEARELLERARAAVQAVPVREADGTWDADERERLERGDPATRPTEPPTRPDGAA